MKATAYDILARAHELLEAGWCQGTDIEQREGGLAYCALGALHAAEEELGGVPAAFYFVGTQVDHVYIPRWNDWPGRTQAEVLAVFAKAAEAARGEGEK